VANFETIRTENFVATISRVPRQTTVSVNFWARHEYDAWILDTRIPARAFKMDRVPSRGARPGTHKELARLEAMVKSTRRA
jgi:hypothetical protein